MDSKVEKGVVNKCTICGKPVTGAEIGKTCEAHKGKLQAHADHAASVPEGWLGMSKVCRAFEAAGFKTSEIVKAAGGDAATQPVLDPMFKVVYVGRRKYMNPLVLTKGMELLKATKVAKAEAKPAKVEEKPAVNATANAIKQAVKK
jgi:hypothetical protein